MTGLILSRICEVLLEIYRIKSDILKSRSVEIGDLQYSAPRRSGRTVMLPVTHVTQEIHFV